MNLIEATKRASEIRSATLGTNDRHIYIRRMSWNPHKSVEVLWIEYRFLPSPDFIVNPNGLSPNDVLAEDWEIV